MTAREKLEESAFFLNKMRESSVISPDFRYYSSACISAMYATLEHLLYDYGRKYWSSINIDDYRLDEEKFELLSKATDNAEAKKFIDWYKKLRNRINSDPDAKEVWGRRHKEIHRTTSFGKSALNWVIEIIDTKVMDNFEYGIKQPSGEIVPTGARPPTENQIKDIPGSIAYAYFPGYSEKEVRDVFNSFLDLLKRFLDEAEDSFGAPS